MAELLDDSLIERSPYKLGQDLFKLLFNLNMKQPWLERRQDQLFSTLEICQDVMEQRLICDLLSRFKYFSPDGFEAGITEMACQINDVWECAPEKTIVVAINRTRYSDSSNEIVNKLKPALSELGNWGTTNFVANMTNAVDVVAPDGNVILVDEFVGSGETFSKAIKWFKGTSA